MRVLLNNLIGVLKSPTKKYQEMISDEIDLIRPTIVLIATGSLYFFYKNENFLGIVLFEVGTRTPFIEAFFAAFSVYNFLEDFVIFFIDFFILFGGFYIFYHVNPKRIFNKEPKPKKRTYKKFYELYAYSYGAQAIGIIFVTIAFILVFFSYFFNPISTLIDLVGYLLTAIGALLFIWSFPLQVLAFKSFARISIKKSVLTFLLVQVILVLLSSLWVSFALGWTTGTIDYEGGIGSAPTLVLDRSDNPQVTFNDADGNLIFFSWNGSEWSSNIVDSNAGHVVSSLALDSLGQPHISYYDSMNKDLKYARLNGKDWHIETVDSEGDSGAYSSIAIDSNDNPHISYLEFTNYTLKYAIQDEDKWIIENVDPIKGSGAYNSIELDSNDIPHVSYHRDYKFDGALIYAKKKGEEWTVEIVDFTNRPEKENYDVGRFSSLKLDSLNNPHISYHDLPNGNLKYAKFTGVEWIIETVESKGDVGLYTSIDLDTNDNPHISYYDLTLRELKYAKNVDDVWKMKTLDSSYRFVYASSISVDFENNPHIFYSSNDSLKFSFKAGKGPIDRLLSIF